MSREVADLGDAGVDDRDDRALAVPLLPGVRHPDLAQVPLVLEAGVVGEALPGVGALDVALCLQRRGAGLRVGRLRAHFLHLLVGEDGGHRVVVDALDVGVLRQLGARRGGRVGVREVDGVEPVDLRVVAEREPRGIRWRQRARARCRRGSRPGAGSAAAPLLRRAPRPRRAAWPADVAVTCRSRAARRPPAPPRTDPTAPTQRRGSTCA